MVFINTTGNPGMASAGMGDVLAGLIGGFWAQGMDKIQAAYAGVYIHGYAGDIAMRKFGEKSLMAKDVEGLIPQSLLEIERYKSF
jgi:NAD(P)H-hydrate epimerase